MEEKLLQRLETSVFRLVAVSVGPTSARGYFETGGDGRPVDLSIVAFEDMMSQYLGRASNATEKIGGLTSI